MRKLFGKKVIVVLRKKPDYADIQLIDHTAKGIVVYEDYCAYDYGIISLQFKVWRQKFEQVIKILKN